MATLASLTVDLGIDTDPIVSGARRAVAAVRSIGSSVSGMTQDAEGNWHSLDGRVISSAHANATNAQRMRSALAGVGQMMRGIGTASSQVMAAGIRRAGSTGASVLGGLGKSLGVVSVGAIGAAGALAAVPLAIAGLGIAAAAQTKSVQDAFSGLKDHVMSTMQDLAQPLVGPLTDAAGQLRGIFDEIAPMLGDMFKAAAPMIEPLVGGLGDLVKGLLSGFVPVMENAQGLVEGLAGGLGSLGDGLGGFFSGLSGGLDEAGGVFESLFGTIGSLLPTLGELMGLFLEIGGPILSKLLDGLQPLIDNLGPMLTPVIEALGPVLDQLVDAFLTLLDAIVPILPPIVQLVAALLPALTPLLAALVPLFEAVGEVVQALVPIIQFLTPIIAQLAAILANHLAKFIKTVVVPAVKMIAAILRGDFSEALELAKKVVRNAASFLKSIFTELPGRIGRALAPLVGKIWGVAKEAGRRLVNTLRERGQSAINWVRGLPGRARKALGGIGSALANAGRQLIQGFINGIRAKFSSVRSTLSGLTSKLTSWKGPESLDKRILTPAGRLVIGGFMAGIDDMAGPLRRQLQGVTSDLPGMTAEVTPKGVMSASMQNQQTVVFDVTGADEDMKRLIRRIVKNDGRGNVQTAFGR